MGEEQVISNRGALADDQYFLDLAAKPSPKDVARSEMGRRLRHD